MTLYVDASAFIKRYTLEPGRTECEATMLADPTWVTARHTLVEVRRNLARVVIAQQLDDAMQTFNEDWARTRIVELDAATCAIAADLAVETGARTLDALHLAAAWRGGASAITFLTFDIRLARHARELGFRTLGA